MAAEKDSELTSSHEHNKSTATHGMIPCEKDLKTTWIAYLPQRIKGPHGDR